MPTAGMREKIVDALVAAGAVTRDAAAKARAQPALDRAAVVAELVEGGIDPRAVASAASVASGIPLLPEKWLRTPKPPARLPAELSLFARLGAAPVGTLKGQLCIVYADPETVSSSDARALPEHRPFLATAADVRRLLDLARESSGTPALDDDMVPRLPSGAISALDDDMVPRLPSGAISALPLPAEEDADTIFEQPRLEEGFDHLPETANDDAATIRVEPRHTAEASGYASPALQLDEPREPLREIEIRARPPSERSSSRDEARERALAALPRFQVRGVLGRGGMATVYLADDKERGGQVALKLMEPHLADDATFVERFRREVRATSSFDHPNVVRTYDAGLEGDTLYMASEYVDGGTLRDLLVGAGPMPAALVGPILSQALRGLAHAHDRGIVHRDLKPANILLSTSGVVKVGDFGVAKSQTDNTLTQSGMLFGTPAYMSPEQAFGKPLDGRSDLFSLATLCYELLTGRNPFHHENMSTSLLMVSKVSARPLFEVCPTLPPLLEEVLSRMMERDRGQRVRDAHTAADKLEPLIDAIKARHGNVLEAAVRQPRAEAGKLVRAQAEEELRRAQRLLAESEPRVREAAFRFFKAKRLDPDNPASASFLQHLTQNHGFTFDLDGDAKISELEDALAKKPDSPALLRRGADLMLARRNLLGAAVWMRRYSRAQPGDLHMEHALESIVGTDPIAPFSPLSGRPGAERSIDVGPPGAAAFGSASGDRREPASVPFVLGGGDETAYVRSASQLSPAARFMRRPAALFGAAVIVLVVVISVPLLFVGDDEGVPGATSPSAPTAATATGEEELLGLEDDPARLQARLDLQRRKIAESRELADKGQLADATAALDAAIAEDPGSELAVDALLERARLYVNLRRMADARLDLEKVTRLVDENDPRAAAARQLLAGL